MFTGKDIQKEVTEEDSEDRKCVEMRDSVDVEVPGLENEWVWLCFLLIVFLSEHGCADTQKRKSMDAWERYQAEV